MKFTEIKVLELNVDKLNKHIDKVIKEEIAKAGDSAFAPQLEEGVFLTIRSRKYALIVGTDIVIDDECIDIEKFEVYKNKEEKGKKTWSVFPSFTIGLDVNELISDFAKEETNIVEFMADRYNYNDRIGRNQRLILEKLTKL